MGFADCFWDVKLTQFAQDEFFTEYRADFILPHMKTGVF